MNIIIGAFEIDALARLAQAEAREQVQRGAASAHDAYGSIVDVVINRAATHVDEVSGGPSNKYPGTIIGVIEQRTRNGNFEFSALNGKNGWSDLGAADPEVLRAVSTYLIERALGGKSVVGSALQYYNPERAPDTGWADDMVPGSVVMIGSGNVQHVFSLTYDDITGDLTKWPLNYELVFQAGYGSVLPDGMQAYMQRILGGRFFLGNENIGFDLEGHLIRPTKCFPAHTRIQTSRSTSTAISALRVGDVVLAFDARADKGRGALVPRRVARLYRNATTGWIRLRWFDGTAREVITTPGHHASDEVRGVPSRSKFLQATVGCVLAQSRCATLDPSSARRRGNRAHRGNPCQARQTCPIPRPIAPTGKSLGVSEEISFWNCILKQILTRNISALSRAPLTA